MLFNGKGISTTGLVYVMLYLYKYIQSIYFYSIAGYEKSSEH